MIRPGSLLAVTLASALIAPALVPQAAAQGADAIARWTAAKVVHYHMVGVYDGPAVIAYNEPAGQATVTDRVEIDLDWDVKASAIIGEPKIVNAASEVRELRKRPARVRRRSRTGPTITST